jgi:hypothetical protein
VKTEEEEEQEQPHRTELSFCYQCSQALMAGDSRFLLTPLASPEDHPGISLSQIWKFSSENIFI